jgi:uncharacterized oligopeptide transporter (OPT) family protein
MFGITTFSQSPFSTLGSGLRSGVASITAAATVVVTTSGLFVYGTATILGTSTLGILAGLVSSGTASVSGITTLSALGGVTYLATGAISGTGNLTADGHIQGNNWVDVPVGSNIWLRIG